MDEIDKSALFIGGAFLDKRWEKEIERVLVKEVNPHFIIVFGSYAKGNKRSDSDLDLAYATDKPLTAYENFLIAQQLADSFEG